MPNIETKIICADSLKNIQADLFSKDAIERIIEARTRYYQPDISQKERQAIADEIIDVLDVAFLSFFFQIKDIPEHTDPVMGGFNTCRNLFNARD